MINITVNGIDYELKTTLGVAQKIEAKFKSSMMKIVQNLGDAEIQEMIDIIAIASGEKGVEIKKALPDDENWDYGELMKTVSTICAKITFSGTPEIIEKKISGFPAGEEQKNAFRAMMGIPLKQISLTGNQLSESDTESE